MNDASAVLDRLTPVRHAWLATLAREPPGWPFATLVAISFEDSGRPLLFLSALAEHTRNLERAAQASLAFAEPLAAGMDPLSGARLTLVGECRRVAADEDAAARASFLAAHPESMAYAGLADFGMWRLEVERARWVGGFGAMGWWSGEVYARAWASRVTALGTAQRGE